MSDVLFVSDLHLGHRGIVNLCPGRECDSVETHDEWVIRQCLNARADKKTLWYFLGDIAFDVDKLQLLHDIPGRKKVILGNHDRFKTRDYLLPKGPFEEIKGGFKRYDIWITHIPVHSGELRGHPNIHGHSHIPLPYDPWYLNACIEWLPDKKPISLDAVRKIFSDRKILVDHYRTANIPII